MYRDVVMICVVSGVGDKCEGNVREKKYQTGYQVKGLAFISVGPFP